MVIDSAALAGCGTSEKTTFEIYRTYRHLNIGKIASRTPDEISAMNEDAES